MAANEKFIITDVASLNEVFKLFEDDKVDGEWQLSEYGLHLQKVFESAIENRVSTLLAEHVGKIDQALDAYLEQELEESVDDIRKLCLLAVSEIGGPEAVDAFIKKVAALARAGALSASSSEWAQGPPDDSASNKDLRPRRGCRRSERGCCGGGGAHRTLCRCDLPNGTSVTIVSAAVGLLFLPVALIGCGALPPWCPTPTFRFL